MIKLIVPLFILMGIISDSWTDEYGVPIHVQYSMIHFDQELYNLLGSHLLVNYDSFKIICIRYEYLNKNTCEQFSCIR